MSEIKAFKVMFVVCKNNKFGEKREFFISIEIFNNKK